MFFEDEKEIIREGADIHIDEDGTVTWEDVLNTENDIPTIDDSKEENIVDLGDELELVENDDVNDEELTQILTQQQPKAETTHVVEPKPVDEPQKEQAQEEDFDIDSQLASVVLEQNKTTNESYEPRKREKQNTSSSSPLLLVILLIVILAGGGYYGYQYLSENDMLSSVGRQEPQPRPTPQHEMNNITPEQLEQRQQVAKQEEIPVVNEEEAQEIKPEEEPKKEEKLEEKKQVINVIPTGRPNPFMPIAKYATTDAPDAEILYDKSGIPKPPETYGIKEEETVQLMAIAVSGIMYDDTKPSAIITVDNNDYFVQKGDRLDDYRIIDIAKNYVLIALGKNVYKANVGEEFKVSQDFYGKAEFVPQAQGGGKQYRIISNDQNQGTYGQPRDNRNGLRYVSEEDITINAR